MEKKKKFDKSNNERRKSDFIQRLLNRDADALCKFMRICTPLNEDEENIVEKKFDNLLSVITQEFDLQYIKQFDCKIITPDIFHLIVLSSYTETLHEIGEYCNTSLNISAFPYIIELSDGTSIKVILIDMNSDELYEG